MVKHKRNTIQVEFLQTVAGLGKAGEIKTVSIAQANNQLIPKNYARVVSDKTEGLEATRKKIQEKAKEIETTLHGQKLHTVVQTNGTHIAGHFDGKDACEVIKKQFRIKILPDMIRFEGVKHPKKIGEYTIHVDIVEDVYIKCYLDIKSI